MTVSEFLNTLNPVAERIRQFEGLRHTWLLNEHNIELITKNSSDNPGGISTKLITLRLKESNPDAYLLRFFPESNKNSNLFVQVDGSFNSLNKDQSSILWGVVASYCNPDKFPNIDEEHLNDFHSNEWRDFFQELYGTRKPVYKNARRLLNDFTERLRSASSSESH